MTTSLPAITAQQIKATTDFTDEQTLESKVITTFNRLSNLLSRPFYRHFMAEYDLSIADWRVLVNVHRNPGISANSISEATGMTAMNVSRAVASLKSHGRLEARRDPEDSRRNLLWLTEAGEEVYRLIKPEADRDITAIMGVLTHDELMFLNGLLGRLADNTVKIHAELARTHPHTGSDLSDTE